MPALFTRKSTCPYSAITSLNIRSTWSSWDTSAATSIGCTPASRMAHMQASLPRSIASLVDSAPSG